MLRSLMKCSTLASARRAPVDRYGLLDKAISLRETFRVKVGRKNDEDIPQWATIRERGSLLGVRAGVLLFKLLGRRFFVFITPILAIYYCLAHHRARRASYEYFCRLEKFSQSRGIVTPKPNWRSVYKHFLTFSRTIVDKISVWTGDMTVGDVRTHTDPLREWLKNKKGAVLFSAHLGNVEVMRAVAKHTGIASVSALMFTKNAARFNRILEELNPESRVRIVSADSISVETAIDLEQRIEAGECVAIMADRVSATAPDRSVTVSFLGSRAKFPEGPFILASLMACPVFFCSSTQTPGGYEIEITKFADKILLPRAERRRAIEQFAQQFAEILENLCLEHPYQWFNFYEFWSKEF